MPRPTVPMANGDFVQNRHHMLTRHLLGLDPALQRVQGLLIATHIREVAVEMRRDREVKELACKADEEKRIPNLLGSNLT